MRPLRLMELRKAKGVSQKEVANVIGVSRVHYTNIENGKRETNFEKLTTLAEYFDVSTDYLLGKSNKSEYEKLVIPKILKEIKVGGYNGILTQEDVNQIAGFVEYVLMKKELMKKERELAFEKERELALTA